MNVQKKIPVQLYTMICCEKKICSIGIGRSGRAGCFIVYFRI